jgi:hypothetical protein
MFRFKVTQPRSSPSEYQLTIERQRIRQIHVIADPAKVGLLSSQLAVTRSDGGI